MRTVTTCSELWCALTALAEASRLPLDPRRGFDWRRIARDRHRPNCVIRATRDLVVVLFVTRRLLVRRSETRGPFLWPLTSDPRLRNRTLVVIRPELRPPCRQTLKGGILPVGVAVRGAPQRAASRGSQVTSAAEATLPDSATSG